MVGTRTVGTRTVGTFTATCGVLTRGTTTWGVTLGVETFTLGVETLRLVTRGVESLTALLEMFVRAVSAAVTGARGSLPPCRKLFEPRLDTPPVPVGPFDMLAGPDGIIARDRSGLPARGSACLALEMLPDSPLPLIE